MAWTVRALRRHVLVFAAGIAVAVAASSAHLPLGARAAALTGNCTPDPSWPAANGSLASQVLTLINQHRASLGLPQLATSPTLSASAVWKARHMAEYNYFSHDDPAPPVARTAGDRIATCGYPSPTWGENIAWGYSTAQDVLNGWLASAPHKANIENPVYHATGLGVAPGPSGMVWVEDFGDVVDGGSAPPPPPTTTTPPPPTTTAPPPPTTTATTRTTTTTTPTTTATTPTRTTTTAPTTTGQTGTTKPTPPATRAAQALQLSQLHVKAVGAELRARVDVAAALPAASSPVGVKCGARVGGHRLRVVVNVYRNGRARCTWLLHDGDHGRNAKGFVRVRQARTHIRVRFVTAVR